MVIMCKIVVSNSFSTSGLTNYESSVLVTVNNCILKLAKVLEKGCISLAPSVKRELQ
jgi:hypothetical protein